MVDNNTAHPSWPSLLLPASGLFSKWGFNDGALLYEWLQRAGEDGCDVDRWWCAGCPDVWEFDCTVDLVDVLVDLVENFLLPAIPGEFTYTHLQITCHNPVRISTWRGKDWGGKETPREVENLAVWVPGEAVIAAIRRHDHARNDIPAPPDLRLAAQDLFSPFGFEDGELLRHWLTKAAAAGCDVRRWWCNACSAERLWVIDLNEVLCELVRTHLVPQIPGEFTLREIGTSHNPIRIESWHGRDLSGGKNVPPEAAGISVTVPGHVVRQAMRQATETISRGA
ncbi:hypothetical protein [Nocardia sp. NPDC048505]|uniref:hypothetical protein n=1 Tax=unclassified Nocardia TaxID=2637762 RepID=UPI0033EF96BF